MDQMNRLWLRLRYYLLRSRYDREMEEEMRHHLDLRAAEYLRVGMSASEAHNAALRRFGNPTVLQEARRSKVGLAWIDTLGQDARYAWRSVARAPGFTLLVILTFTLGFGVNAATFRVLDTLFLRPPGGVAKPSELRRVWQTYPGEGGVPYFGSSMSGPEYRALAELAGPQAPTALYGRVDDYRLGGPRGPKVDAAFATASYFPLLGVRPALGRFYTTDEDHPGSAAP
jgi:hypothetical protein